MGRALPTTMRSRYPATSTIPYPRYGASLTPMEIRRRQRAQTFRRRRHPRHRRRRHRHRRPHPAHRRPRPRRRPRRPRRRAALWRPRIWRTSCSRKRASCTCATLTLTFYSLTTALTVRPPTSCSTPTTTMGKTAPTARPTTYSCAYGRRLSCKAASSLVPAPRSPPASSARCKRRGRTTWSCKTQTPAWPTIPPPPPVR